MAEANDLAPNFALQNQDGVEISLADFRGKWVVLYFYPKDNTGGCSMEAREFSAARESFEDSGAVVLGVSPDSVKSHQKFIAAQKLSLSLLSDQDRSALESYGVWKEKSMYGRKYMGVERSTFLIDPEGAIAHVWRKVKVSAHADEVLEKLRELKKRR